MGGGREGGWRVGGGQAGREGGRRGGGREGDVGIGPGLLGTRVGGWIGGGGAGQVPVRWAACIPIAFRMCHLREGPDMLVLPGVHDASHLASLPCSHDRLHTGSAGPGWGLGGSTDTAWHHTPTPPAPHGEHASVGLARELRVFGAEECLRPHPKPRDATADEVCSCAHGPHQQLPADTRCQQRTGCIRRIFAGYIPALPGPPPPTSCQEIFAKAGNMARLSFVRQPEVCDAGSTFAARVDVVDHTGKKMPPAAPLRISLRLCDQVCRSPRVFGTGDRAVKESRGRKNRSRGWARGGTPASPQSFPQGLGIAPVIPPAPQSFPQLFPQAPFIPPGPGHHRPVVPRHLRPGTR